MRLQSENIRDEGTWHYIEGMNDREDAIAEELGLLTCYCGRGAAQKAKRDYRLIRERLDQEDG